MVYNSSRPIPRLYLKLGQTASFPIRYSIIIVSFNAVNSQQHSAIRIFTLQRSWGLNSNYVQEGTGIEFVISGYRCHGDEVCTLLGCDAADYYHLPLRHIPEERRSQALNLFLFFQ
jgi:hypothetical protein